jgi:hypothetical protein
MAPPIVPMAGRTFGRLTVLRKGRSGRDRHRRWVCRCECGRRKEVAGNSLRSGKVKSCTCEQYARFRVPATGMQQPSADRKNASSPSEQPTPHRPLTKGKPCESSPVC